MDPHAFICSGPLGAMDWREQWFAHYSGGSIVTGEKILVIVRDDPWTEMVTEMVTSGRSKLTDKPNDTVDSCL